MSNLLIVSNFFVFRLTTLFSNLYFLACFLIDDIMIQTFSNLFFVFLLNRRHHDRQPRGAVVVRCRVFGRRLLDHEQRNRIGTDEASRQSSHKISGNRLRRFPMPRTF